MWSLICNIPIPFARNNWHHDTHENTAAAQAVAGVGKNFF